MAYIGSTEDRINKWMRMCLQWQFDIRRGIEKRPNHYFTKYHVGKYPKRFFDDLSESVVDRDYVINKMNLISEDRMNRDRSLGINSNKVVIEQVESPDCSMHPARGIKVNDDTVVKKVAKRKHDLSKISTHELAFELYKRASERSE